MIIEIESIGVPYEHCRVFRTLVTTYMLSQSPTTVAPLG